jgi:hypothetical protein
MSSILLSMGLIEPPKINREALRGVIRTHHTGNVPMNEEFRKTNLPPPKIRTTKKQQGEEKIETSESIRNALCNYVIKYGSAEAKELMNLTGLSKSSVVHHMKHLEAERLVVVKIEKVSNRINGVRRWVAPGR